MSTSSWPGSGDCVQILTSRFWQTLFKYAGVDLHMSLRTANKLTAKPSTSQSRCLETYFALFCPYLSCHMIQWLPLAQVCNSSLNSALRRPTFAVLYGHDTARLDWLSKRALMQDLVRQRLRPCSNLNRSRFNRLQFLSIHLKRTSSSLSISQAPAVYSIIPEPPFQSEVSLNHIMSRTVLDQWLAHPATSAILPLCLAVEGAGSAGAVD